MTDPNECPCTTGHNSFDGKTLAELGNEKAEPQTPKWDVVCSCGHVRLAHAGYDDAHRCQHKGCPCVAFTDARAADDDDGRLEANNFFDHHPEA